MLNTNVAVALLALTSINFVNAGQENQLQDRQGLNFCPCILNVAAIPTVVNSLSTDVRVALLAYLNGSAAPKVSVSTGVATKGTLSIPGVSVPTLPGVKPTVPVISAPTTSIPTLPAISVPTLPTVSVPTVPAISEPTLPAISVPTVPVISAPTISIPTLPAISVPTLPAVSVPTVPVISVPTLPAISISTPKLPTLSLSLPNPPQATPTLPAVVIPTLPPASISLPTKLPTISIPTVVLPSVTLSNVIPTASVVGGAGGLGGIITPLVSILRSTLGSIKVSLGVNGNIDYTYTPVLALSAILSGNTAPTTGTLNVSGGTFSKTLPNGDVLSVDQNGVHLGTQTLPLPSAFLALLKTSGVTLPAIKSKREMRIARQFRA